MENNWNFGVKFTRAHALPKISSMGWGEPLTHYISCSCGWRGLTVHEVDATYKFTVEPYKTFEENWGTETYYALKNELIGDYSHALKQLLEHLSYEPSADLAHANELFKNTKEAFDEADNTNLSKFEGDLLQAVKELRTARERAWVWNNIIVKRKIIVSQEALDDYKDFKKKIENKRRA